MSAKSKASFCSNPRPAWHAVFEAMLPAIRKQARFAFRTLRAEAKDDAVEDVLCSACVAFHRLIEQGKADIACPTALARFAIRQYWAGRRTGSRLRIGDILSPCFRRTSGIKVERLDRFDLNRCGWIEAVVPDHSRPVPEQAAFRIDFPAWLATRSKRDQKIIKALAAGDRPMDVARRFKLSRARISQLRNEFRADWQTFHGEKDFGPTGSVAS